MDASFFAGKQINILYRGGYMRMVQELFEKWAVFQFGDGMKYRFLFDRKDGYKDEDVNALWVGFCAGHKLGWEDGAINPTKTA